MRVEIRAARPGTGDSSQSTSASHAIGDQDTEAPASYQELLPKRYNTSSALMMEVVEGSKNEFNFDLKSQ